MIELGSGFGDETGGKTGGKTGGDEVDHADGDEAGDEEGLAIEPANAGGAEPDPLKPATGPTEGGGSSGASIAPTVPDSSSEFDPARIAASVGTDAKPTNNATSTTYRRVGARKPPALYTPFRRLRMTLSGGTCPPSSSGTAGHPSPSAAPRRRKINLRLFRLGYRGERRMRRMAAVEKVRSRGRGCMKTTNLDKYGYQSFGKISRL